MTSRIVLTLPSFSETVVIYTEGLASEVFTPVVSAEVTTTMVTAEVSTQVTTIEEP